MWQREMVAKTSGQTAAWNFLYSSNRSGRTRNVMP
jgi:hypothetical protein